LVVSGLARRILTTFGWHCTIYAFC